jgi:hypothetical protein
MRQRLRSSLTYANVMATLAVFLVLGGGTAVALNGSNTVQSDDLGPGAQVKAADVAENAVGGTKVINGSLKLADMVVGQATVNHEPFGSLQPTQCEIVDVQGGAFSGVKPGDVALVFPDGVIDPLFTYGFRQDGAGRVSFALCNGGDNPFDPPSHAFKLVVLR